MSRAALMNNYGTPPVTFVRGDGTELWDDRGRHYLDFLCGLAVTGLGHAHPAVTEAVAARRGRSYTRRTCSPTSRPPRWWKRSTD